jgi:hypothetical protein
MFKTLNSPKRYLVLALKGRIFFFRALEFWSFVFVSYFVLRISNLKATALDLTVKLDINPP